MRSALLFSFVLAISTAARPAAAEVRASGPVVVRVYSDTDALSAESVRAELARELGVVALAPEDPAAAGVEDQLAVSYKSRAKELAVTYSNPRRGTLTRVVPAPDSSPEVASTAALLGGDLARNEASELLGEKPPLIVPVPPVPPAPAPVLAPAPPNPTPPQSAAEDEKRPEQIANAGFFYPLSTNYAKPNLRTHFDLNLLHGHIGELEGLQIGTVSVVEGQVQGAQVAVAGNVVGKRVEGLEIAGLFNSVSADVTGLQIALGLNRARLSLAGLQASAGLNLAGEGVVGAQLAVFGLNHASGPVDGFQLAALGNFAGGRVRGLQGAIGVNKADNVDGVQLALVNIGRKVSGTQLGLVNYADEVDGVPIGLVSVTRKGGVHPLAWVSNTIYGNFGVKFATRYTYTLLSLSTHTSNGDFLAGPGFAIGGSIPVLPKTAVEIDLGATHLFADTKCCGDFFGAAPRAKDQTFVKLRAMARYAFLERLSVFAGAGLTGRIRYPIDSQGDTDAQIDFGSEFFGGIQL